MSMKSSDPAEPAFRLPVTIIGGYLGSGKTTLINKILSSADGCKYAVMVNDFGNLAIDAQLIESQDGDVISLTGGCVCCSYGNDLTSALMELENNIFDQVVIEASGVALPGSIAGSVSLLQDYVLSSIVVLADSTTIEAHAKDKYLSDTIERQLRSADVIVINKVDLINDEQLSRVGLQMKDDYPSARIISVSHAGYPAGLFLVDMPHTAIDNPIDSKVTDVHQTSIYTSFVLELPGVYDVQELAQTLTDKTRGLLRVKGFVRDAGGVMQTLQIVGKRSTIQPAPDGVTAGLVCIGLSAECCQQAVKVSLKLQ